MHFAFIAPPFLSHVRAMEALAAPLLARHHRVTWIHQADVRAQLRHPRIEFHAVGRDTHPAGSLAGLVARAARPGGWHGLRRVIEDVAAGTDMLCREGPSLLRRLGVEAIVADQMEAAGGLLADGLGLPFASVACALPVNREPRIPLPVMHWGWARDARGAWLNEGSTRVYDWMMQPHARVIRRHAKAFGLRGRSRLDDCLSTRLQISQTTAGFDFPRAAAPARFHAVGPLRTIDDAEPPLDLPLHAGRPFAFASLGTLQGGRFGLFERIVQACRAEGVQVLVAHCNGLDAAQAEALRRQGATAVTGFAPQRAALARADVVITHAGLNTALDALAAGTPQLALPIAFDQPGVAARLVHAGTGLAHVPALVSVRSMRRSLRRLLDEPAFAARSHALGEEIARAGGAAAAARLVEVSLGANPPDAAGPDTAREATHALMP